MKSPVTFVAKQYEVSVVVEIRMLREPACVIDVVGRELEGRVGLADLAEQVVVLIKKVFLVLGAGSKMLTLRFRPFAVQSGFFRPYSALVIWITFTEPGISLVSV